jgi:hypothetical protein
MPRTKGAKNKSSKSNQVIVAQETGRPSQYQKLSLIEKREVIATRKKRGDMTKIANQLEVTPTYVSSVLSGRYENKTIVNRMYNMVRGRKAKATN